VKPDWTQCLLMLENVRRNIPTAELIQAQTPTTSVQLSFLELERLIHAAWDAAEESTMKATATECVFIIRKHSRAYGAESEIRRAFNLTEADDAAIDEAIAALASPSFNACKAQKVEPDEDDAAHAFMLKDDEGALIRSLVDAPAASVGPTADNGEVEMSNSATKVAISILRARAAAFDDESDEQQAVQCRQTAQDLENELYAATGIFADLKAQVGHWQNRSVDLESQRTDAVLNYRALFNTYTMQTADVESLRAEIARLTAALELSCKANLALADELLEARIRA